MERREEWERRDKEAQEKTERREAEWERRAQAEREMTEAEARENQGKGSARALRAGAAASQRLKVSY
jgi:hypothetical protein